MTRSESASLKLCSSGGLHYVLSDLQGSARTVMTGSSIVARHDYLPFGEEIASAIGLRSAGQGYTATDLNRWKYAITERDATSGLDHTLWRKYDNLGGRWTSPDPYGGSITIANAQTLNRYTYVLNDPINSIDPIGLCTFNIFLDLGGNLEDVFVNSAASADYSLTVKAAAPKLYKGRPLRSDAVGVTALRPNGRED